MPEAALRPQQATGKRMAAFGATFGASMRAEQKGEEPGSEAIPI